jgi:putative membrane protein insertion efficiency factor
VTGPRRGPVARALLAAVGFYSRAISPALPPRCRFAPTCSAYAAEAIALHGAGRGSWLAVRRLLKCAPWHPGGFDPVPPRGTPGDHHSSGSAVPSAIPPAVPSAELDRSHRDPTSPPAPGRSAQQEARVA